MKFLILLSMLVSFESSFAQSSAQVKTVPFVDLGKYVGSWYEIASIPQFFSQGCFCTRAKYSKKADGTISVLNTCNKSGAKGELSSVNGTARVDDKKSNSKLSVNFFGPFWGEYWIVGLDKDYRYSVVSNSDGSSLWILSRTPTLAADLYQQALAIAKRNKISTAELRKTSQKGCQYP